MYDPIIEILKYGFYKLMDFYMYMCYWHPVNHKMWFDVYRNKQFKFTGFRFNLSIQFKYIDDHGGGKLAKVDYIAGSVKALSIFILFIILGIVSIVYAHEHHLGIFKGI